MLEALSASGWPVLRAGEKTVQALSFPSLTASRSLVQLMLGLVYLLWHKPSSPLQHNCKICNLLWPWNLLAERRGELKTSREEPVTSACSARTRGFAAQHHKTRNVNLQMMWYIGTRWSHNSPQQHTSISPHHQSYPGSEWGSNKEMGKKSIIETKYRTCNSM